MSVLAIIVLMLNASAFAEVKDYLNLEIGYLSALESQSDFSQLNNTLFSSDPSGAVAECSYLITHQGTTSLVNLQTKLGIQHFEISNQQNYSMGTVKIYNKQTSLSLGGRLLFSAFASVSVFAEAGFLMSLSQHGFLRSEVGTVAFTDWEVLFINAGFNFPLFDHYRIGFNTHLFGTAVALEVQYEI